MTTKCEKMYLGIDGGGTKTDAAVCDEHGKILSRAIGGGCAFTGQTREKAEGNLRGAVEAALAPFDGCKTPLAGVCAGIAGCGLPPVQARYQAFLTALLPAAKQIKTCSDAINALSAGIGAGDGVIAIAGTGSSVFCRVRGVISRVGGWGYLLGDEGSGFDLGKRALTAALRAIDGRGEKTALTGALEEHFGVPLSEAVAQIYSGDGKSMISSCAPILLACAEAGDGEALSVLHASAADLAETIETALAGCPVKKVVLTGSVWKNEMYLRTVKGMLGDRVQAMRLEAPPVLGALIEAVAMDGADTGEAFALLASQGLNE